MFLINLLIWIILGAVAGGLAKLIMPGPDPGGTGMTILLGIAGAFVGGFLGRFAPFLRSGAEASISLGSIFTATVGATVILALFRHFKKA